MKFLKTLFSWFIKGHPAEEAAEEEIAPPQEKPKEQKKDDPPIPSSEMVLSDIFDSADPHLLMTDLQNLETASKKFDNARDELIKELKNLGPRAKINNQ